MRLIQKYYPLFLVVLVAIVFFIITAGFNFIIYERDYIKWGSPDETANYFFVKNYAESGQLSFFEPANLIDQEIVRPRSMRSDHGWLKPVSFLGIIVYYGFLASILGTAIIPYITPFLASLAIIFFFLLVKRLFNHRIALISSVLLAFFPVYIYYTVRSLFHNVLFLFFLILFAYFLSLTLSKKYSSLKAKFLEYNLNKRHYLGMLWSFLTGLFLGGAIASRSSELIWLLPIILLIWIFYFKRLGIRVFLILAGASLAFLPIAYYNQLLFGSFIYGGYAEMNTSIQSISQASGQFISQSLGGQLSYFSNFFQILKDNIFYFGYQPRQALNMFNYYVIEMFPLLVVLSGIGFLLFFITNFKKLKRWHLVYLLTWFILSSILVLYYGSWEFFDNPDASRHTIGNSYTRYWLPIYLLALPLAALSIVYISKLVKFSNNHSRARLWLSNGFQVTLVFIWIIISLNFVFFGSEEGLIHAYYNHKREQAGALEVLGQTEENAIIVTQYHDKQLFPERKVVVALFNHDLTNQSLSKLIDYYPIYYYNFFFPENDFNYLNNRRLVDFGLNIELIDRQGPFGLYRLIKHKK